jgi:hypothetical protein
VREKADQKVYSRIGEYRLLKAERPGLRIGLCGCVAQREGERALARVAELDFVLGPARVSELRGLLPGLVAGEKEQAAAPAAVTVALEFLVEDLRGTPVSDIRLEEVEVVQDATRQRIRTFERKSRPGRYELTYAPQSGKAGGVTVRVTRSGTVMRGPDGGSSLKPRVISALSPLEAGLTGAFESAGAGEDGRAAGRRQSPESVGASGPAATNRIDSGPTFTASPGWTSEGPRIRSPRSQVPLRLPRSSRTTRSAVMTT